MAESKQIIKSASSGYGYKYASLADIARQGCTIPKMATRCVDGQIFICWLDDNGEWIQGAPVIVPEMRGMNAAQAMGSALTYARRYTALMALGLASDDDDAIETARPANNRPTSLRRVDFAVIREHIKTIDSVDELESYWRELNLSKAQAKVVLKDFSARKAEIGGNE